MVPRSIAGRQAFLIVILAVLVIMTASTVGTLVVALSGVPGEVGVLGRQRMLSQRLALTCAMLADASDPAERGALARDYSDALDEMSLAHQSFTFGTSKVGRVIDSSRPEARVVARFLRDARGVRRDEACVSHGASATKLIAFARGDVLRALDDVVRDVAGDADRSVRELHWAVALGTVSILLVIGAQVILVFGPMRREQRALRARLDESKREQERAASLIATLMERGEAALTIEPSGVVGRTRSRALDRWFGPLTADDVVWDWLGRCAAAVGQSLERHWDQACRTLDFTALPTALEYDGKTYEMRYRPLLQDGELRTVCLLISPRR
ncbi:MAG: hypothetical protein U0235_28405 [Polyangiaceae bacterium]